MPKVKQLVEDMGLKNSVLFLGSRPDTEKLYSAFDVYAMPSISEGLSIAICEAQANGLPCIASSGVTRETDISGNVHFLNIDSIEKWVEAIIKCNRSDEPKLSNSFDINIATSNIYNYYYSILRNRNSRIFINEKKIIKKRR